MTWDVAAGRAARPPRRAARTLVLGLVALAPIELGLSLWLAHSAPSPDAYAQLHAPIAAQHQPGDLLVVTPRWAEPHVRAALGAKFFPLPMVARSGSETFERATEISLFGDRAPELSAFRLDSERTVGPFRVRQLVQSQPEVVTFDFVQEVAEGRATVSGSDRCRFVRHARISSGGLAGHPSFPAERFQCPEGGYYNVSATVIANQAFEPRYCIYAHPPPGGVRTLQFSVPRLGSRLVGDWGLYWVIERQQRYADVELEISVGGELLSHQTHQDGQGFSRFEVPLGVHAGAENVPVSLRISTEDASYRHICLRLDSRR